MFSKQLTALEDGDSVGDVGDKVSSTQNMHVAQQVLAGVGVNGFKKLSTSLHGQKSWLDYLN